MHFKGPGWLKEFLLWRGVLFLHIIYATPNYEKIRRQARPCWRLKTPLEIWKWKKPPLLLPTWYFKRNVSYLYLQQTTLQRNVVEYFYKLHLNYLWQLSVDLMSWLEYKSAVIFFLSWKIQKCPKKLGLNHHHPLIWT